MTTNTYFVHYKQKVYNKSLVLNIIETVKKINHFRISTGDQSIALLYGLQWFHLLALLRAVLGR